MTTTRRALPLGVLLVLAASAACLAAERTIPSPLPDHPGNVFLAGEKISVVIPVLDLATWHVTDYDGKTVAEGRSTSGRAEFGPLPVGWYELRWGEGDSPDRRTSVGVLQRLAAPTPDTSPIGIDVAMAWFYKEPQMPAAANLCALAGVNWVRDRLSWGEVETKRGEFASAPTKYDASARIQAEAGLRVLQVNHSSPGWANPNHKRFPEDLRDAYRFYREMARRWAGQVAAFEPWNEADIVNFGGHTGAEMASMQKAAYLGLKEGNPGVIACQNVFASTNKAILADLAENQAWPYFDTFNLHHYAKADDYPEIYAAFRPASAGRPLWTTEFSMPVQWSGDEKRKEPTDADLRVQSERVAKAFAAALHEGSVAAFYFLLPHYVEGQTQFGIVRPDLTPRPAYVALAAVGRLLADARPRGRLLGTESTVRAFYFRAKPDGRDAEVLVAWTEKGEAHLDFPAEPQAVFDHLGRPSGVKAKKIRLTPAPLFVVFTKGAGDIMDLHPPPDPVPQKPAVTWARDKPLPVVLQAIWPKDRVDLSRSAYLVSREKQEILTIYAYNFSDKPVTVGLGGHYPAEWKSDLGGQQITVTPGERTRCQIMVDARQAPPGSLGTFCIEADFEEEVGPILSLRLAPEAK